MAAKLAAGISDQGYVCILITTEGAQRRRAKYGLLSSVASGPWSAGQNNRNANIAIGPERIEQNCIIAAPHSHVDA